MNDNPLPEGVRCVSQWTFYCSKCCAQGESAYDTMYGEPLTPTLRRAQLEMVKRGWKVGMPPILCPTCRGKK